MRRLALLVTLVGVAVAAVVGGAPPASAHPLGNATINHYTGLTVHPDRVDVDYVLDLAEIPTFQERDLAGQSGEQRCAGLVDGIVLSVDGDAVPLTVVGGEVELLPGDGDLDVTRIECDLTAPADIFEVTRIGFEDRNHEARLGWREVTATGVDVDLVSPVPTASISERLRSYPQNGSQPDVRGVELVASPGDGVVTVTSASGGESAAGSDERADLGGSDPLLGTLAAGDRGLLAFVGAMLVAAGLGAAHGMAPGHGKTVIGAFLVATRGTRRQAFLLTLAVAVSHTLGVFVLGAITVVASSRFAPERVYPYLQLVSAAIVLSLGAWILGRLLLDRRRAAARQRHHDHVHSHAHELVGAGAPAGPHGEQDHHHDHGHHHDHDHRHDHDHGHHHDHDHGHHHDHGHGHGGSGWHTHGLLPHRHGSALSELDPSSGPLSARALVAIGLSGGLVPSTSAVLLLLGAVQLERLLLGGLLVLGFGAGMAVALVGTGLGIVAVSRRASDRLDVTEWGRRITSRLQPIAGLAMVGIGVFLTVRALGAMPA